MVATGNNRQQRLRRAGLIVGLASVALWIILVFVISEGGFSWYSVPNLILVIPFLAGVLIAWRWPFAGGIVLIVMALYELISVTAIRFSTPSTNPILELLLFTAMAALPLGLPPLATGILFLLSGKAERPSSDKISMLMPKLRQAGLVIMLLAGVFCFFYEFIRSYSMRFSVIDSLQLGLVIGGSLILLTIATWAWPLWGGIIGVGYSSLIIAYYFIAQSQGRTLLQLLSDFRLDMLPFIVLLTGSALVLASVRVKISDWRSYASHC
jgi:hypothetical protein